MLKPCKKMIAILGLSILLAPASYAAITPISENFESLDALDADALGNAGWVVFANVFSPDGLTYLYGYGVFPAPNGSGGFSNVSTGEGGVDQGAQGLVVFNDYNNADHNVGNRIEANVFVEQTIEAVDVGSTWTFQFDVKQGDIVAPSTALAFIKTLDPGAGFATTNFITEDTTATGATWNTAQLSITIDAGLVGQLIQVGFSSTAANFDASGVNYDNVFLFNNDPDSDGDGVSDSVDNCTAVMNAGQEDADNDGFGNRCDPDFDNNCIVNFIDVGQFASNFGSNNPIFDIDSSGVVNFLDYPTVVNAIFGQPGPSALAACDN